MEKQEIYLRILELANDYNSREPGYFYPSSLMRAEMGMSLEELRPYAEELDLNGYIKKSEGLSPTFQISIEDKGKCALLDRSIVIEKSADLHIPLKLEILKIAEKETEYNDDKQFYITERTLLDIMKADKETVRLAIDE